MCLSVWKSTISIKENIQTNSNSIIPDFYKEIWNYTPVKSHIKASSKFLEICFKIWPTDPKVDPNT